MSYSYVSTGGLLLSNNSICSYMESGNVLLNSFISSEISSAFIKSEQFTWDVIQTIELNLSVSWDVGSEKLYWYTVEGICKPNSGCATTGIPSGSKGRIFSRTVAARNLSDLCFKLKTLYLNYPVDWPVTKILRYKKPVYLEDVDYTDNLNSYNLLENNNVVKTDLESVDVLSNEDVLASTPYPDNFTLILPDSRKIVKHFESGILKSVDIVEPNGSVKKYRENSVATITAVPSSLISINYKIQQQIENLNLDDNTAVLQQYCHIPECLAFCINEDLLIEIGCTTNFTDAFYDYIGSGTIQLSGNIIVNDVNQNNSSGTLIISGSSLYSKNVFNYVPFGTFQLGSSPIIVSSKWKYVPLDANLDLSGNSVTVAKNLNYQSYGILSLSGNIINKFSYKFLIKNARLRLSGTSIVDYEKHFRYVPSNGLQIGAGATYNCSNYNFIVSSGLILSGNFETKSNRRNYVVNSGLDVSGNYLLKYRYLPSSVLLLASSSLCTFKTKSLSGGVLRLGENALIKSSNFSYSSGGSFALGNSFDTNITNELDLMVDIGANINLLTYEPVLPELYGTNADPFTFENGLVVNYDCGCGSIPVKLYLNNNITNSSILKTYLKRNNLTLSNDIDLTYNDVGKSWRYNAYLNSVNNSEKWMVVYEWSCSELDSLNVWNLSISISRKLNGIKKITNLSFLFDQTDPCNNEKIDFNFNFNTNTKNIVSPIGLNILKYIIKDDIGLFKDKEWLNTSLLKIKLSETQSVNSVPKKDIFSIFPD